MDIKISGLGGVYWVFNLIYSFKVWGILHGILNMFIPYALAWDMVVKFIIPALN